MAKVEMYIKATCPFCVRAKRLLDMKNVDYVEYEIAGDQAKRSEMIQRSKGGMTVPQIFIDDEPIGGADDMFALERAGKLDALLGRAD